MKAISLKNTKIHLQNDLDLHNELHRNAADKALQMMKTIDTSAIVAGGAPRDWYLGKPASDIDLYFVSKETRFDFLRLQLEQVGFDIEEVNRPVEHYLSNPDLIYIFESKINQIPLQIMLVRGAALRLIEKFPLSICLIWYKDNETYFTSDFLQTAHSGVITKVNKLYSDGEKYLKKILAKFPEYKYDDGSREGFLIDLNNV